MPLLPENALFIGKVVQQLQSVDSTNRYATAWLAKNKPIEGMAILTEKQWAGRGQIGSSWLAEAGKNLLFSLILCPQFLDAKNQFALTQAVALGIVDILDLAYPAQDWQIKWPNDIYGNGKKVGGMLIENQLSGKQLQHSVVGIGLNVNQLRFEGLPQASSIARLTQAEQAREPLLRALFVGIERRYLQLRPKGPSSLRRDYLAHLLRYQTWADYEWPDGQRFRGQIIGVQPSGQLALQTEDEKLHYLDLKALRFVW